MRKADLGVLLSVVENENRAGGLPLWIERGEERGTLIEGYPLEREERGVGPLVEDLRVGDGNASQEKQLRGLVPGLEERGAHLDLRCLLRVHPVVEGCNALERVEDAECAEYERERASSARQREVLAQTAHAPQSCGLLSELGEGKSEACHCYVSIGLEGVVSQTEEGSAIELEDSALAAPQIQLELVSSHFDQERVELEGVASREGDSLDCVLICHAEQLPVEPLLFRNRGVSVVFMEEVVVEDGEVGARALMTDDPSLQQHCIPHKGVPSDDEASAEGPTRGENP